MRRLACFVTSHGLGHATRACAVMAALHALEPQVEFDIYSHAPTWAFAESLRAPYRLHSLVTDIGLVQLTPFEEDLPETLRQLGQLLPYSPELVDRLARELSGAHCELVLCDIAPLGIVAAQKAGIPSVLVENFRWDWIYAGYLDNAPQLQTASDYFSPIFQSADNYIQTEPVCDPSSRASLTVPPISRSPRLPASLVRHMLGIPPGRKAVLVTSSTTPDVATFAAQAQAYPHLFFIFPADVSGVEPTPNGVLVSRMFYHPDLVNASDAVVGKAGYSTLAETYYAGGVFAYIGRPRFRESAVLGQFIQQRMAGFEIPPDWQSLDWLAQLSACLDSRTPQPPGLENAAFHVARYLLKDL